MKGIKALVMFILFVYFLHLAPPSDLIGTNFVFPAILPSLFHCQVSQKAPLDGAKICALTKELHG